MFSGLEWDLLPAFGHYEECVNPRNVNCIDHSTLSTKRRDVLIVFLALTISRQKHLELVNKMAAYSRWYRHVIGHNDLTHLALMTCDAERISYAESVEVQERSLLLLRDPKFLHGWLNNGKERAIANSSLGARLRVSNIQSSNVNKFGSDRKWLVSWFRWQTQY